MKFSSSQLQSCQVISSNSSCPGIVWGVAGLSRYIICFISQLCHYEITISPLSIIPLSSCIKFKWASVRFMLWSMWSCRGSSRVKLTIARPMYTLPLLKDFHPKHAYANSQTYVHVQDCISSQPVIPHKSSKSSLNGFKPWRAGVHERFISEEGIKKVV